MFISNNIPLIESVLHLEFHLFSILYGLAKFLKVQHLNKE